MSSQLKEKQQQKDNKRDLEADDIFNKQLFSTVAYAGAGFGAGLVASVFLKHRKALTLMGTAAGGLYGANNFMSELNQFGRFKEMAKQGQQPQTLKREDQLATKNWDQFQPKEQSAGPQKRYGGSGDDDDKKSRSGSESKTQQKQQQPSGSKESPNLNPSRAPKESDKNTQQSGASKSGSASLSPKEGPSKSSQEPKKGEQQKKESQGKEQHKEQPQKNVGQGKEQHKEQPQKKESQGKEQPKGKESGRSGEKTDSKPQGQNLQDFKTNPGAGKPAPGESEKHRGAERNVHSDNKIEEKRDQQNRSEQDRWGKSKKTGNKMKVEHPPENIAGGQFSGDNLTAHSQVNAVIE